MDIDVKRIQSKYQATEHKVKVTKMLEKVRSAVVFTVEKDVDEDHCLVAASAFINEETEERDIMSLVKCIEGFLAQARGEDNDRETQVH